MEVQELPTKIVDSAFELVRLPVTVVADHLGPLAPQDVECWAPRLGVDALEGVVKETVGTLLRDEHMRASSRRPPACGAASGGNRRRSRSAGRR
jgi:hypothetical protein